jgi:hypothetical protein
VELKEPWLGPTTGKESRMHQRKEGPNETKGGKRAEVGWMKEIEVGG